MRAGKSGKKLAGLIIALMLSVSACAVPAATGSGTAENQTEKDGPVISVVGGSGGTADGTDWQEHLPAYDGLPSVDINNGVPFFTGEEMTTEVFEEYSDLDELGRCGPAFANVCRELMPTEERESISSIKPTGWHSVQYEILADQYLYNRCHLIGYQLAGENANEKNLITGTRYMNVEGMLPWENLVAEYVDVTGNHVLYRATPDFEGENLVADGVLLEAYSVEDGGAGVCFNVYCYNVQPGIVIDYATGETSLDEGWRDGAEPEYDYVLNTNTMKFHLPDCSSVKKIDDENKELYAGSRDALTREGYSPCGNCKP